MTLDPFNAEAHARQQLLLAAGVLEEAAHQLSGAIVQAARITADALAAGNKLLLCGNGGSAADAQHVAAEFVGRFLKARRALPAIALTTDGSSLTAISNDYGFERVFARQVEALGAPGDILIAISTSGRSPNIIAAADQAKQQEMVVIAFTGAGPAPLGERANITLAVPSHHTPHIQVAHIALLHTYCELVETMLFRR
jgi:D-sedoheptulose 7-phosphate isomerase